MDLTGELDAICNKGDYFCDVLFAFQRTNPLVKVVCSIKKEFALFCEHNLSFRLDPFSEGDKNNFDRVASPKRVPLRNTL